MAINGMMHLLGVLKHVPISNRKGSHFSLFLPRKAVSMIYSLSAQDNAIIQPIAELPASPLPNPQDALSHTAFTHCPLDNNLMALCHWKTNVRIVRCFIHTLSTVDY